jgi:MFS family permease
MRDGARAFIRVARDPRLRRLQLGYAGFAVGEHATWLAIVVYAFEQGGVRATGVVAVVQLVPAMLVAPLAAYASDRFRRDRVLAVGYGVQATSMALTATGMWAGLSDPFVYALAALVAISITFTRPALNALLPSVTHVPSDLTAANVVMGTIERAGMFGGPVAAGVLIAVWSPAAVFAFLAVVVAGAAVLVASLQLVAAPLAAPGTMTVVTVGSEALDGLRSLRRHSGVRVVVMLVSLGGLVNGAADVLFVVAADELTEVGSPAAGAFGAGFGLGAVLGAVLTVSLVGRARMTPYLVAAVGVMALSLLGLAAAEGLVVPVVLFAVMGGGDSAIKITGSTMIQRIAPGDVLGRIFGVVEGLNMGALAAGSAIIAALIGWLGFSSAMVAAGFGLVALLLLRLRRVLRVDRGAVPPDATVVDLLVHDPILGPLPAPVIERLAVRAERRVAGAGTAVITEGEEGDRYFLIESGGVHVTIDGRSIREMGRGAGFGEIALMRAVPRTATVTATTDTGLVAVAREEFLEAVTGHPHALATAHDAVRRYLDG